MFLKLAGPYVKYEVDGIVTQALKRIVRVATNKGIYVTFLNNVLPLNTVDNIVKLL